MMDPAENPNPEDCDGQYLFLDERIEGMLSLTRILEVFAITEATKTFDFVAFSLARPSGISNHHQGD